MQQLAAEGIIPRANGERGHYSLVGAVQGYVRFLQERVAGRQPSKEIDERQKKLLDARVDKARLEADKLAGRLISLDEARSVGAIALRAAATHFRSLGSRLRAKLAPISDPALIQGHIDDETRKILAAAASDFARLGPPA